MGTFAEVREHRTLRGDSTTYLPHDQSDCSAECAAGLLLMIVLLVRVLQKCGSSDESVLGLMEPADIELEEFVVAEAVGLTLHGLDLVVRDFWKSCAASDDCGLRCLVCRRDRIERSFRTYRMARILLPALPEMRQQEMVLGVHSWLRSLTQTVRMTIPCPARLPSDLQIRYDSGAETSFARRTRRESGEVQRTIYPAHGPGSIAIR